MNIEPLDLCTVRTAFANKWATTTKDAMSWVDRRVFRKFNRLQSIYGSTSYMNPKSDLELSAQVNTPYFVYQTFKAKSFRNFQHSDGTTRFKASLAALKAVSTFLK